MDAGDSRSDASHQGNAGEAKGSVGEVFWAFLSLGFTSFGGPIAHLGYFRTAFVERRGWLSDPAYADLVALCQFLPGPASSQVGMAIGLKRAGPLGMLAAWVAFTLPSAIALTLFGLIMAGTSVDEGAGWVLGLKAAAVAVVAHAFLGMTHTLASTRITASIAACAAILVLVSPFVVATQLLVIAAGGLAGALFNRDEPRAVNADPPVQLSKTIAIIALALFFVFLVVLPWAANTSALVDLFDRAYRAGALVFGGGHVVLPLLEGEMRGLVDENAFLAGYGAAQAVPGPLFTFVGYLGAIATPVGGVLGAAVALVAIFLPGALLVLGVMPFWEDLRSLRAARHVLAGVNAAVVGLLGAALYDPVFTRGVPGAMSFVVALGAFILLRQWQVPPWAVVVGAAGAGALLL
ncbi:MAG: chromate efflux transporter [Pseudomonadota bacterium]